MYVYLGDILEFNVENYDFIILGDVLEHIPVKLAQELINISKKRYRIYGSSSLYDGTRRMGW
jgi:hypothetical protein